MTFDVAQLGAFVPLWIVAAMACVVLLAETFVTAERRSGLAWMAAAGCLAAFVATMAQWDSAATPSDHFASMLRVDRAALFFDGLFTLGGAITLLSAEPFLRTHRFQSGEFYALVLLTVAGMIITAHATHFASLLVGLETMSLGAYALTGSWRRSLKSTEGALKYYLMGAFATGFLAYGMALVYGTSGGAMSYAAIAENVGGATAVGPLLRAGVLFLLVALAFKVSAVPFHMWAPDAYEGAPTPITGFMAAGVKAAAFAALLRLFGTAFGVPALAHDAAGWPTVVALLAALTMTVGNLGALRQDNVKRMLAYSSVAHAGYVLVGVAAMGMGAADAQSSILYYLAAYTFTTLGTFGVIAWAGNRSDERLFIDDWAGLGQKRPAIALAMTVFLLSLGGVPPTGGFFGKFFVFRSAIERPELIWLVIVGVLNSVVSVYYYLRLVVAMYFRPSLRSLEPTDSRAINLALFACAVLVVLLGVLPGPFVSITLGPVTPEVP